MLPTRPRGEAPNTIARRGRLDRLPPRGRVATHRALFEHAKERRCDLCDTVLRDGEEDGGSGLYVWTRGDELRFEEPPLCAACGPDLAMIAMRRWEEEDEEEE